MSRYKLNKKIVCADGFEMSVQANDGAYCSPRVNGAERYTAVEVGFPSREEPLLLGFCDEPDKPTETVYGYVPVPTVTLVIAKHGGIVSGQLPAGIPHLLATV
jgi:hypothetical protein